MPPGNSFQGAKQLGGIKLTKASWRITVSQKQNTLKAKQTKTTKKKKKKEKKPTQSPPGEAKLSMKKIKCKW